MLLLPRWTGTQRQISLESISKTSGKGEMLCGLYVMVHPDLHRRQLYVRGFYNCINDCHSSLSIQGESQVRSEEGKWLILYCYYRYLVYGLPYLNP